MKFGKGLRNVLVTVIVGVSVLSCVPPSESKESPVKTDVEKLSQLIHLPQGVNVVQWEVLPQGTVGGLGPNDWELLAIIEIPNGDTLRSLIKSSPISETNEVMAFPHNFVRGWFPQELVMLWAEKSPGQKVLTVMPRNPAFFLKSPLLNGFFVPFGSKGQIFLYLYTQ